VAGPWSVPQAVADELCFRYEYDARNRMIVKKVPGAGELDMVYDARDRLVMSQDAQLQAQHKWQYMVYDDLNRSTASGLLTDPANYNHPAYHQGLAAGSTAYPNLTAYSVEQMLQTYYDAYASLAGLPGSMAGGIAVNGSFFNLTYNSAPLYAVPVAAYPISRGLTTGIVAKVVGTSFSYVYSETFYDDRGRAIQTFSSNYSGGIDTMTTQYNFAGKILRVLVGHAKANNTAQHHRVLTKISYDPNFRVTAILKNIDQAPTDQSIASMQYNEVGQLQSKTIGNNLDNLVYDYNVRGWTTGINKAYLDGTAHNYFGMQLGYDKGVAGPQPTQVAQFTGNIDGVVWKSAGDGIRRKFDFKYDNANHITRAEYNKNSSGDAWDVNTENYSMWGFDADNSYGIKYDANGNLMMMILGGQKGIGSPQTINALRYTYMSNSNKLRQVTDDDNDPNTTLGNFHYNSATKTDTDYGYDANGNLLLDKNKTIDKITYNYLNLPQLVHMNGKGNILYTYDAAGNKLQKQVIDSVSGLATTTLYLGGFQYQRRTPMATPSGGVDTLQFVGHEEGRARWAFHKYTTGDSAYAWEYDFMEKDHLGNTRVLLTQQRDTANYMCTMEPEYRTMEDALFTGVDHSVYTRPAWMPPSPHGPSSNNTIALVDGSSYQVGPAKLLKVMSGDTVVLGVDAWVTNGAVTGQTPSSTLVLNGLANGLVSMTGPTHGSYADLIGATSPVAAAVTSFLAAKEPTPATLPKAYLNWMLLDNHMNYVSGQSGAIPVTGTNAWCSLATSLPLTTSGYLYIWVSNESHWVMFYDNLSIEHIQGPMLEEDHYYPFGMQMAGLCDKALKSNYVQNRYKFKGKEEQRQEFNDGSGLEWLDFGARMYDDQIGRWHLPDPLAEKYNDASPYAFVKNNPINNIEIDGRWFNKKNEKRAAKIGAAIDKRIGKIEKQIASLQKGGKDIGDRRERIDELNKSKGDIQNMRDDKANEYRYEGVGKNPGPVTTPEGESGHVIVMHTENSMGSKLHEGRHGGELARGETNFKKDDKGNWLGGNLYGVNDEISAYRAQYAYSGRLDFIEYFNPDVLQGVQYLTEFPKIVSDHTLSRTNINDINASLINSMADKKGFTLERIYSKQFVNETEWNKN
jgi:RHS repeat-associated protein